MENPGNQGEIREEDTMKILLATDCHLGYEDSTKRLQENDSFITFEEILKLALKHDVDMLLLGGDLFHDSKPSQKVVRQCMELLRKYAMGERNIKIQFLSDPEIIFRHASEKVVNYEDPNLNVAIPIFSIHGNHDNPSFESTGMMDILEVSGFVNYFGKWANLNDVTIPPLVFNKGKTFVSVYGLSYMNDQRLSRLLRDDKLNFLHPSGIPEPFKIFVLHQNRAKHTANGYIPENKLPAFLDLIFWGHEHQCRVIPEQIVDASVDPPRSYYITQPGSPVATSLCEGEATEKHIGLLKVNKTRFIMEPIKLETVRPFVFDSIHLNDADVPTDYTKPLADLVCEYIDEYIQNVLVPKAALQLTGHPQQPTVPLVRLRIFYSEEAQLFDPVRISRKYHDTVANSRDMIIFRKDRLDARKKSIFNDDEELEDDAEDIDECFRHEEDTDSNVTVQGYIEKYFSSNDRKNQLPVFSVEGLNEALNRFVQGNDDDAFEDVINYQMKKAMKYMEKYDIHEEAEIIDQLKEYRNERLASEKSGEARRDVQSFLDDGARRVRERASGPGGKIVSSKKAEANEPDPSNAEEVLEDDDVSPRSRGRGARGKGRATRPTTSRGRGSSTRGRGKAALDVTATKTNFFLKPNSRDGETTILPDQSCGLAARRGRHVRPPSSDSE